MRRITAVAWALVAALGTVACGMSERHTAEKGGCDDCAGGGTVGTGGSSSTSGGGGGFSGSGAMAAGDGGRGDSGGAGRPSSGEPECETNSDCVLASDCCGCRAEPRSAPYSCPIDCAYDGCTEVRIPLDETVVCVFGTCVFSRSCDRRSDCAGLDPSALAERTEQCIARGEASSCDTTPPSCADGQVPIRSNCWGSCIDAEDCYQTTSCDDCPDDTVCVVIADPLSSTGPFFACRDPAGCRSGEYCECFFAEECRRLATPPDGASCFEGVGIVTCQLEPCITCGR